MAYLKPQSPIKDKDGDYIYPLTTIDQVVMEDGQRLNTIINDMSNNASIPSPEASDDGKFLKVINGSPTWTNISIAEEIGF